MRKLTLAAATAIGTVIGAVLFNATPARADLPTIDATVLAAVNAVKGVLSDINGYIQDVKDFLSATGPIASLLGDNTFGTVEQLLQQGFTQTANYQKASVGALEQIFDASNTANARFKRDVRNAQIRDEQTPSPTACTALDGGVSTQAAAVQAFTVAATIAKIHDLRGEAGPNMPSYYGQAQGIASISQEHLRYYCDANDAAAGLCAPVPAIRRMPTSSFRASSALARTPIRTRSIPPRTTRSTSSSRLPLRPCAAINSPQPRAKMPLCAAAATTPASRSLRALSIRRSACRRPRCR